MPYSSEGLEKEVVVRVYGRMGLIGGIDDHDAQGPLTPDTDGVQCGVDPFEEGGVLILRRNHQNMVGVSAESCSESGFGLCVPLEVLGDGIVIECWHRRARDRDKVAG